jgi:hypothetical protein
MEEGEITYSAAFANPAFESQTKRKAIDKVTTISIQNATIALSKTAFTYNGKVQKPSIQTIDGKTLEEGTDYTASWSNASSKNVGTYTITVSGIGRYAGTAEATYRIDRATNPLSVTAKKATVKFSTLKTKAQALGITKVVAFKTKAKGAMTYTKVSGNKAITIDKKTGKVTIKKGLKKGTYKVKVKMNAAGNANYKPSPTRAVSFTIVVR